MATFETALEHTTLPKPRAHARVMLEEKRGLAALVLRLDPAHAQLAANAGHPLPERLSHTGKLSGCLSLWIGPDEFLLLFAHPRAMHQAREKLAAALGSVHHALVDSSGTHTYLLVSGAERIRLLRKLCPYDLQHSFPLGKVVGSLLDKSPAILVHLDAKRVLLLIRNSFADHTCHCLVHAAEEFA